MQIPAHKGLTVHVEYVVADEPHAEPEGQHRPEGPDEGHGEGAAGEDAHAAAHSLVSAELRDGDGNAQGLATTWE